MTVSKQVKRREESITLTKAQWLAMGTAIYGPDTDQWKFRCPICGNVAAIGDYRQFKDKGATPDSAATECLGRYKGGRSAFYEREGQPCDYASWGLFRIGDVFIDHGKERPQVVFDFADEVPEDQTPVREGT
jgi:hypothetical protein